MCVQGWAYRLAAAPDPAPQVAEAAIAACYVQIERFAGQVKNEAAGPDAFSESMENLLPSIRRNALFRVVQARAGGCEAP
jgi:hypothetical protein